MYTKTWLDYQGEDKDDEFTDKLDDSDNNDDIGRCLTIKERESLGMYEEVPVAIKVAYVREFHSPDECDWRTIVTAALK
jgi:hypothetical protein